jgi:sigma-B regulation protein RsbU (phosphoserine phosphatase)
MSQLVSNLVGNACTHGNPATPVLVEAFMNVGDLEIFVANGGTPIPQSKMQSLFQPFSRDSGGGLSQGLGLGLFISSEIAKSHGGVLTVSSSPSETRFTFRMPVASA